MRDCWVLGGIASGWRYIVGAALKYFWGIARGNFQRNARDGKLYLLPTFSFFSLSGKLSKRKMNNLRHIVHRCAPTWNQFLGENYVKFKMKSYWWTRFAKVTQKLDLHRIYQIDSSSEYLTFFDLKMSSFPWSDCDHYHYDWTFEGHPTLVLLALGKTS